MLRRFVASLLVASLLVAGLGFPLWPAKADTPIEQLVAGVVRITTSINPEGRTVGNLGAERSGTGIVIGSDGLVLTIGYLMVEAQTALITLNDGRQVAAEIVGYDYDTGFGLLRAASALNVAVVPLGRSADIKAGDKVLVALSGGLDRVGPAHVASKREFAGYWEYLLDEAIFTTPPYQDWSGAALINREGRLVGVGSLVVNDAAGKGSGTPGNMFVPIDRLPPILAELITEGRVSGPAKPWLGINAAEVGSGLQVQRVTPGSPAEKAGVKAGDRIVGVDQGRARTLGDFYRSIWALGAAGVMVPLAIERDGVAQRIEVTSVDRRRHLRLDSSL